MALTDRAPQGLLRLLLRAPVWVYRARLGWLFGHRLVYLAHRGRRSGRRRETVLEVVRYDKAVPEVYVVAGWGARADWYRNLRTHPALEVRIGAGTFREPYQRFLEPDETVQLLLAYRDAHPRAWRRLAPLMGLPADPRQDEAAVRRTPAVAFRPADR
ncbi:MAG: nitroreductase family deazaflavin-dependent oxidoreductase [Micromonosporaceae bacterium]